MSSLVAEIVIDGAAGSYDKRYDYRIPENYKTNITAGCRVTVPFGAGNIKKQGMVLALKSGDSGGRIKEILGVTDDKPIINEEMILMCEWMHEHIFCTYFDAIHAMLPSGLNYNLTEFCMANDEFAGEGLLSEDEREVYLYIVQNPDITVKSLSARFFKAGDAVLSLKQKGAILTHSEPVRRMNDKTSRYARLCTDITDLDSLSLTQRQREVAEIIFASGSVSVKEIQYFTGVSAGVISALEKKGIIELFDKEEYRIPFDMLKSPVRTEIKLTKEQSEAYSGLKDKMFERRPNVSLLYGVTGSGKTQVFLKLVDDMLDYGRGIIIMVPEIALTPQIINLFSSRYGDKIAVFHSAMSLGQRMDEYKRIKQGKAKIAIGTRSAVFAPFSDLGLIIIDEEQEHTYKSERTPKFSAIELAKFRISYHNGMLCLASATPSLESYSAALMGKYSLFTIKNRYGGAKLPNVSVVDMKREILEGNSSPLSRSLIDAITEELEKKKQIILLLNRRGHNTYISCPQCGYVASCPNCSLSLTYHSANKRLMCHYCGYSEPVAKQCPQCSGEHLAFFGAGTQKIEEELNAIFKDASVLRLDADSTMANGSYARLLGDFAAGKYDIMLGTQMVAKGLDFPNVSLVGIIGADRAFYSEDYRGFERTFSLLTQVSGRAGRAGGEGRAIIQTVDVNSNVIELAKRQDYEAFFNDEIKTRQLMIFPPYCDICQIAVTSKSMDTAKETAYDILSAIKENISGKHSNIKLIILGPAIASIPKINGRYRYRMIIKCRNNKDFREMLRECISVKKKQDISISVDINPETVM